MYWHVVGPWNSGLVGILGMVLWVAVLVLVAWLVVRIVRDAGRPRHPGPPPVSSAEELLRQRFASGEIDEEEYRRRLEVLRGS